MLKYTKVFTGLYCLYWTLYSLILLFIARNGSHTFIRVVASNTHVSQDPSFKSHY